MPASGGEPSSISAISHQLGPSALLPLIELERRAGGPELRDRARYLRIGAMTQLAEAPGRLAPMDLAQGSAARWRAAQRRSVADVPTQPAPVARIGRDLRRSRADPAARCRHPQPRR